MSTTTEIAPLAELWRYFTTESFGGYSPLYAALGRGIAEDPELIQLTIDAGTPAARFPLVLMAAVHELVLTDAAPELSAVYAEWRDGPAPTDPFPTFRAAALDHRDALLARMATETTQTNEVGRSSLIGLALAQVAGDWAEWGLVEAGASAGLNLRYDRYLLDFGAAGTVGDPASPVRIETRPIGPLDVPASLPVPVDRVGLDRDPIDLRDDAARRWLLACTWPDTGRMERTAAAHEIVRPPDQDHNVLDHQGQAKCCKKLEQFRRLIDTPQQHHFDNHTNQRDNQCSDEDPTPEPERAGQPLRQRERDIGAKHIERAVCKIHDPRDAKDDRQARRNEEQRRCARKSGQELGKVEAHQ